MGNGTGSANAKVTKTFSFELQDIWIFYRTRPFTPNALRDYWGLIVAGGGLKTDAEPKVASRFNLGFRTAINPSLTPTLCSATRAVSSRSV